MVHPKDIKQFMAFGLLIALLQLGVASCNNAGKKQADAYETESKDSADNLNRTKFNGNPLKEQTAQYLADIYLNSLYSLTLSQEALNHRLHDTTEHIARLLVEKHKSLNKELQQIANSLSISIPGNISNTQQKEVQALQQQKGLDFESAYLNKMIHAHKETYTTLLKTEESSNEQLREWSKKSIPVLEALNSTLMDGRKYIDTLQITSGGPSS